MCILCVQYGCSQAKEGTQSLTIKPKMMIKKLEKHGFKVIGHKGSHVMLSDGQHYTEVPKHSKELPKGLERAILKQAGLQ